jgi:hypothetical protein
VATRKPASQPATRSKAPGAKTSKRSPAAAAAKRTRARQARKNPVPSAVATEAVEPAKPKHKLVRDSFTIPKNEYVILDDLKQRAARLARPAKKSEILRAGIAALQAMPDESFLSALAIVPSLKTGRPKDTPVAPGKASLKKP